ncbi:MAG: LacI family DNA-binding transcriptional regulator [Roseiflexaceae bacterium]
MMNRSVGQLPTMREVATLAGVSIKTVSRVVNQEPGVSPALIDRVHSAIAMLDYHHNTTASSLRRADKRTATIGLLLEDIANPFSAALYRAIEDVARQHNTLILAGSSDEDPGREEELARALTSRRVDGLIIVPAPLGSTMPTYMRRVDRPIVVVDRPMAFANMDSVTVDNRADTRAAVQHLMAHGHQRIAFLGDQHTIWTAAERHLGYVEALAAAGLPLDPRLVRRDIRGIDAAEQAAIELLGGHAAPSAFFAAQNLITIGVIRALQRLGWHHRIALVGFDDFLLADLLDPGVSSVVQDPAALGRPAAELLFARIGGDHSPPRHIVVPTRLVARGSGEIRAENQEPQR